MAKNINRYDMCICHVDETRNLDNRRRGFKKRLFDGANQTSWKKKKRISRKTLQGFFFIIASRRGCFPNGTANPMSFISSKNYIRANNDNAWLIIVYERGSRYLTIANTAGETSTIA